MRCCTFTHKLCGQEIADFWDFCQFSHLSCIWFDKHRPHVLNVGCDEQNMWDVWSFKESLMIIGVSWCNRDPGPVSKSLKYTKIKCNSWVSVKRISVVRLLIRWGIKWISRKSLINLNWPKEVKICPCFLLYAPLPLAAFIICAAVQSSLEIIDNKRPNWKHSAGES